MRCHTIALFLSLLTVAILAACTTQPSQNPAGGTSIARFTTVGVDRFDELSRQSGVVILDVRTPEEFAQGHLHAAVNMNVGAPDFAQKIAALDKNTTYLVNCRSGGRSAQACTQMAASGFTHVYNLEGGISAWTARNKPVEK